MQTPSKATVFPAFPATASGTPRPFVRIYADGSCDPNPGVGGWGAILLYGSKAQPISGRVEKATNNMMEIVAVTEGLRRLKRPCRVTVFTDSQYVVKCGSGEYRISANEDLWRELFEIAQRHEVTFVWVKAHNGDEWNEAAHQLAEEAAHATT